MPSIGVTVDTPPLVTSVVCQVFPNTRFCKRSIKLKDF